MQSKRMLVHLPIRLDNSHLFLIYKALFVYEKGLAEKHFADDIVATAFGTFGSYRNRLEEMVADTNCGADIDEALVEWATIMVSVRRLCNQFGYQVLPCYDNNEIVGNDGLMFEVIGDGDTEGFHY